MFVAIPIFKDDLPALIDQQRNDSLEDAFPTDNRLGALQLKVLYAGPQLHQYIRYKKDSIGSNTFIFGEKRDGKLEQIYEDQHTANPRIGHFKICEPAGTTSVRLIIQSKKAHKAFQTLHMYERIERIEKMLPGVPGIAHIDFALQEETQRPAKITVYQKKYDLNLSEYFKMRRTSPCEKEQLKTFYFLLYALNALHEKEIAHCDIKPDNILIKLGTDFEVALTDFDCSVMPDDFKTSALMEKRTDFQGNLQYYSPEMAQLFLKAEITHTSRKKADIWALGLILYELYYGGIPKSLQDIGFTKSPIYYVNLSNAKPQIFDQEPPIETLDYVIYKMLATDPQNRPTSQEALKLFQNLLEPTEPAESKSN